MSDPTQIQQPDGARRGAGTISDILKRLAKLERTRVLKEGWHTVGAAGEPAFQNTWGNFPGWAGASFYKDATGRVHLRGLIRKGGGAGLWVANETIFVLPAGYRPAISEIFTAPSDSKDYEIRVLDNGVVQVGQNGGAANPVGYASLSGISFRVA